MAKKLEAEAQPLEVAPFTLQEAYAVRALERGTATPEQQIAAMRWIVNGAAMAMGQSFVAGQPDRTAFNEGRRNVAKQIIHLTVVDVEARKRAQAQGA
jgi:hypothetical protein